MRARRVLMVLALVAWGLTPVPVPPSGAAPIVTAGDLCDPGSVSQFSDVEAGDYGAQYILCMRALGLSVGRADGSYGPEMELSRAQVASFLVRLWSDALEQRCPGGVETPFVDVAGNAHEDSIGCLYGLDVTKGTTAVTYGPSERLKASQISMFLLRIYERAGNSCTGAGDELERAVECLTAMKVVPSVTEGSSYESVTRDQMAVYLVGLWHNMAGRGLPPDPPERPANHGAPTPESATMPRRPDQGGDDDDDDDSTSTSLGSSTTVATDNDGTDSDGYDTPETDSSQTSTVTTTSSTSTTQGTSTTIATDNDGTDSDGYDTPETDSSQTSTVTTTSSTSTTQGTSTTIATDNDGTDSDGYDTPVSPASGSDIDDTDDSD